MCPSVRRNSWSLARPRIFDAFYEDRRAAAGEPVADESVVMLTFDGKGVVLHHEDLREATRRAAERRRQQREQLSVFNRLRPGEKKHAKRMATVAAVYAVAPLVRSPEEFLQSLMPRQPAAKAEARNRAKTAVVRPRPVAKRVWASLEHEPAEVVAEAMLEAERHDPERVKRWVVLVDGTETQLDLVEAGAAAYGVDVTVILDIIHVVEYVWRAAHVFHDEGSPELACWAWTRVRDILEGKAKRVAASMRRAATSARRSYEEVLSLVCMHASIGARSFASSCANGSRASSSPSRNSRANVWTSVGSC